MPIKTPTLLLITPEENTQEGQPMQVLEAALQGGVDTVLLRKKNMGSGHLLALASEFRLLTRQYKARLFIHSQADICKAVDADGVHVSSAGIPQTQMIRDYLGEGKSISASCHNLLELQQASTCGVDFALLSPVFATVSHPDCTPLGIDRFKHLSSQTTLPIIALGGITPENRQAVSDYGVAVIRAVWHAVDPKQAATLLLSQHSR